MNSVPVELPLAVVGCDFRVCSSRFRSRLVLEADEARQIARALQEAQATDGFVDLNTCNRNEWIVSGPDPRWAAELLRAKMIQRAGGEARGWFEPYVYVGEQAARHVFRVAIGQESLVVGERQIASQLYGALETARTRGTSSRVLNGLGSVAGRLVRIALRRGCVGNAAVGVHSLALGYLMRWLTERNGDRARGTDRDRVALVGLGRIGRRVLGPLQEDPRIEPLCLNRTIAPDRGADVLPLAQLPAVLAEVDAAVVCTGAMEPVIKLADLAARPAEQPLLLVDIGIPEQVERGPLPGNVVVCGLDELTDFYRGHCLEPVLSEPAEIEELMIKALTEFRVFCNETAFAAILDTVQRHHTQLVREEIPRLVEERFGYLPEEVRTNLEQDLRSIVLQYTSEVFRTIKETSKRNGDEEGDDLQGEGGEAACRSED